MNLTTLLDKIIGRQEKNSKNDAKKRLQLVLLHDRIDLPSEKMEEMKKEIFAVVSKYIDIDIDALEMNLEKLDQCVALVANIPIRKAKSLEESPKS
ncbi:MAG: cell division topological specificity factor MinE [Candidatus Sericytochromatia bacterium]|nr:cell division topological specificity factor MinE [Candidatus Sericytochromatia bacterium]